MKIINFNKPFVTLEDKKHINHVFKNNKYADGYFQKGTYGRTIHP